MREKRTELAEQSLSGRDRWFIEESGERRGPVQLRHSVSLVSGPVYRSILDLGKPPPYPQMLYRAVGVVKRIALTPNAVKHFLLV